MTVAQVLQHYGSLYAATKAIGLARQQGTKWIKIDRIPILQQYLFEKLTDGKLVAKDDMLER